MGILNEKMCKNTNIQTINESNIENHLLNVGKTKNDVK